MPEAYLSPADVSAPFQKDAWITLPGIGEFNPEPETGPVPTVFHAVAATPVPSQLDAETLESIEWSLSFGRPDGDLLRKGAVVRAARPGQTVTERWFVADAQKQGDAVWAFVKLMPEEA